MISILISFLIALFPSSPPVAGDATIELLYDSLKGTKPEKEFFIRSLAGFQRLAEGGALSRKDVITIIDYRLPSTAKRLWVVDLSSKTIILHSLVAHGRNSGDNLASKFSNKQDSHQSSLGFFMTGPEYKGKHGRSLKLIGLEDGINDAAEQRAIVIHGAEYVSEEYIRLYGRLGRSFGCPAVPIGMHDKLIDAVGQGSCVFIYYPDEHYLKASLLGA